MSPLASVFLISLNYLLTPIKYIMKKQNKLEALFPNGKVPEAKDFNRSLDEMSKKAVTIYVKRFTKLHLLYGQPCLKNIRSLLKKLSSMIGSHMLPLYNKER